MSARQQSESPRLKVTCWAVCISTSWLVMQIVDLAITMARRVPL